MRINNIFILSFFLIVTSITIAQKQKTQPFVLGETVTTFSKILQEERVLNIYLPNGYKENEKKYPVIYLLDGSADEDFIHIAGLVQFGSFPWINMLPESIVVGIANVDRKRDFTFPTSNAEDKKDFPTTGGSTAFITYLEEELQPFIAKNYAISEMKTIIGQSLGGLLATEIALKKPSLFDNFIIVSPSIWWDDQSILDLEPTKTWSSKNFYVAVGIEGPLMQTGATNLYYKLLAAAKNTKNRVYFKFLEQQDHGDALHLAVYDAFEKIFKQQAKD